MIITEIICVSKRNNKTSAKYRTERAEIYLFANISDPFFYEESKAQSEAAKRTLQRSLRKLQSKNCLQRKKLNSYHNNRRYKCSSSCKYRSQSKQRGAFERMDGWRQNKYSSTCIMQHYSMLHWFLSRLPCIRLQLRYWAACVGCK